MLENRLQNSGHCSSNWLHFLRNLRFGGIATVGWTTGCGAKGVDAYNGCWSRPGQLHEGDELCKLWCDSDNHWHAINPATHFCSLYSQNEPEHEQLNVQPNNGQNGYGAMQQHVSSNPFAYAASIAEEQVQPEAQDSYMHGNIEDRTY